MARKRKRKKNPSAGTIAVAAGAAIIAGLWAFDVFAKPAKKKKKKEEEEPLPDPDDGEKQLADELLVLVSDDPVPGSLYVIQKNDNLATFAQNILKMSGYARPPKGTPERTNWQQQSVVYQKCVSSSEFNRGLYGKPGDFTDKFPSWTSPDDISIRSAFLNKSADYLGDLVNGNIPQRRDGGRRGMIWLPTLDADALQQFKKVACIDLDPPPLVVLEAI